LDGSEGWRFVPYSFDTLRSFSNTLGLILNPLICFILAGLFFSEEVGAAAEVGGNLEFRSEARSSLRAEGTGFISS